MSLSFTTYADPDFGVLLPTALVLAALGTNEYTIRKFRPLLVENEDYLRIRGEDHVERLFYAASGLLKLCDAIASSQSQLLKQSLTQFLQTQPAVTQPASSTHNSLRDSSIVPAKPQTIQPYQADPSSLDPYTPAHAYRNLPAEPVPMSRSTGLPEQPQFASEHLDPADIMAQRFAPHLSNQIASQVSSRVERALARLEQRQTPQLSQAELLLQQQRLSLEQFQAIQKTILEAQQAAVDNAHKVVGAIPAPEVNLFSSMQVEQAQTPPELMQRMMTAMQIRSWSDLAMAAGGLLALGLSSFLLISALMRPSQRVPVIPVSPSQSPLAPSPAVPAPPQP